MYRTEYFEYKQSFEQAQDYITNLELAKTQLSEKITRLNRIAKKYNQRTELLENTLAYADQNKNKAINDVKVQVDKANTRVYGSGNTQDKGTVTTLHGLDKGVSALGEGMGIAPKVHKLVQTGSH